MNEPCILIVDDDSLIRTQLEKALHQSYYPTVTAGSGDEALSALTDSDVDIVLLDIKLPDYDGIQLLQEVRRRKEQCEVIVITAFGSRDIAIQALRYGAIDYLEKPLNFEDLRAALGRAQEKMEERKNLSFHYSVLIVDDDATVVERLGRILEKEGYTIMRAYSGKEGLAVIENHRIDVIICDINIGDMNGIHVLQIGKQLYRDIEGIVITGLGEQEVAIDALRAGAIDYIQKPINLDELLFSLQRAIERITLYRTSLYRNRELKISTEIITKMNEELERRIQERSRELSQTQAQLFQTSKLATLGEMSAGLAHEMNQPLAGISLVVKNFRKRIERGKFSDEHLMSGLDDIDMSIIRMNKIITHIRTFARQDTMKLVNVRVNSTIDSALNLLREQLRLHSITVDTDYQCDLPAIPAEPYQLEQVWINLISNARDALDEKDGQTKTNDRGDEEKKMLAIRTWYDKESNHVHVTFTDNGIGMSPEIRDRLFEPFFTTKEVGKATGLGLSISYGIIENHQGTITVDSSIAQQTTLHVSLPRERTE